MEQSVKYWYNGAAIEGDQITLPIQDPGLIYGATVFTTLRIYETLDQSLTNWVGHCDRLKTSLDSFHWNHPDWDRLRSGVEWLSLHYPVVRIVIFPDGREWVTGRFLPNDLVQRQQNGITAWVADVEFQRSLPHHKTGNYLAPLLALQTAQRFQAQEAILTDANGNWLESSTGTLWGWNHDRWWTPPLDAGILPGLLRSHLISWLKCQNKEVIEEPWTEGVIRQFEAIAYTNCVMEVIPIHTMIQGDARKSYPSQHLGFQQLRQRFERKDGRGKMENGRG
jgi:4-amino-4-deoxychorismate lyase